MSVLGIATGRSATWRPQVGARAVEDLRDATDNLAVSKALLDHGVNPPAPPVKSAQQKTAALTGVAIGAVVRWIPTEVVVLYGAAVAASQPAGTPAAPVIPLAPWIVCLVASPVLSVVLALSTERREHMIWKAVLAAAAFVLWSETVPNSAWNLVPGFSPSGPITLLVIGLTAAIFTPIAEWLAPQDSSSN